MSIYKMLKWIKKVFSGNLERASGIRIQASCCAAEGLAVAVAVGQVISRHRQLQLVQLIRIPGIKQGTGRNLLRARVGIVIAKACAT